MLRPKPPDSPIDSRRIDSWLQFFSEYRYGVSSARIENWLGQFKRSDKDIAARLLDCVEFVSQHQIISAFRSILQGLGGWNINSKRRRGKWRFVPYSGSAGESGDSMLHIFRVANNLNYRAYNDLFIGRSELLKEDLKAEDTVVFVDDFAGTGDQACDAWEDVFAELLPGNPNVILILVRSSNHARKRIQRETQLAVYPYMELSEKDDIFSNKCKYFSSNEKNIIYQYCLKADNKYPKGYGESGFVLVFAHKCPSNSIPILHSNNNRWRGLFL